MIGKTVRIGLAATQCLLGLVLCGGDLAVCAEAPAPYSPPLAVTTNVPWQHSDKTTPFILAVTNISSVSVRVWTNSSVAFQLTRHDLVGLDVLVKEGVRGHREVRIMDGERVIGQGRMLGHAFGAESWGLMLAFDMPQAALDAARGMRDLGGVLVPQVK
jgi:hypothetical protein